MIAEQSLFYLFPPPLHAFCWWGGIRLAFLLSSPLGGAGVKYELSASSSFLLPSRVSLARLSPLWSVLIVRPRDVLTGCESSFGHWFFISKIYGTVMQITKRIRDLWNTLNYHNGAAARDEMSLESRLVGDIFDEGVWIERHQINDFSHPKRLNNVSLIHELSSIHTEMRDGFELVIKLITPKPQFCEWRQFLLESKLRSTDVDWFAGSSFDPIEICQCVTYLWALTLEVIRSQVTVGLWFRQ